MKNNLYILLAVLLFATCSDAKKPILGDTDWQKKMNAEFKDVTTSPLKKADRKYFETLDFFKVDSTFVITGNFLKSENEAVFKMKTTTDRLPEYLKYGDVTFEISGKQFKLNVYQNKDLIKKPEYEDYLFLPFLDNTNGVESYAGGRYIDLRIPEGDTIIIDFNKAYNPYCAYNDKYSCPVVPRENYLDTEIRAGVKAFSKH